MSKILIVDDASLIRLVADKAAKGAGHETVLAENGEEGLAALENHQVDLIFSDINMPVMGGLVMLTTESNPTLKEQGKALGVKAWLLKPFNKDKFLLAVTKLLG